MIAGDTPIDYAECIYTPLKSIRKPLERVGNRALRKPQAGSDPAKVFEAHGLNTREQIPGTTIVQSVTTIHGSVEVHPQVLT